MATSPWLVDVVKNLGTLCLHTGGSDTRLVCLGGHALTAEPDPAVESRTLPKDIEETLSVWLAYKHRWWFIHYFFGTSALIGSVTIASRPLRTVRREAPKSRRDFFAALGFDVVAWASAVCVAMVTFLTPSRRARAYVAAARILSDARNRYLNDPNYPLEKLLDAVQQGEELIERADPI